MKTENTTELQNTLAEVVDFVLLEYYGSYQLHYTSHKEHVTHWLHDIDGYAVFSLRGTDKHIQVTCKDILTSYAELIEYSPELQDYIFSGEYTYAQGCSIIDNAIEISKKKLIPTFFFT